MSVLDGYSPFDVGFARFANCIELGLGEGRGFMKIWRHGQLEVWGQDADPMGAPSVTFTPDDAELLRELANELESRAGEYEEHAQQEYDAASRTEREPQEAPAKKPQIVAGAGASDSLNNFCLK
jgi:hypothetical protein